MLSDDTLPLMPWTVNSPVVVRVCRQLNTNDHYAYSVLADWWRAAGLDARRLVYAMKGEDLYTWAIATVRLDMQPDDMLKIMGNGTVQLLRKNAYMDIETTTLHEGNP